MKVSQVQPQNSGFAAEGGAEVGRAGTRRWLFVIPVLAFAAMAAAFYVGLGIDPNILPSALIDEPAPKFELPALPGHDQGFSSADLQGHVSLVNTFASWCLPCRAEHPVLNALAATKRVPIYGIDYKDKGDAGAEWIKTLGNPYTKVGADTGRVGIDWGVYGVPETFIVDRAGRIRYKHVGPLTQADIDKKILPLVAKLEK
jgi:cytochrome c biogenesis protein CcmG/thiol:disulfide interchange protein DsbE